MAKSSSLNIRVVEGRALPAKDVSGSSDPYCLVKVDDEVVARSQRSQPRSVSAERQRGRAGVELPTSRWPQTERRRLGDEGPPFGQVRLLRWPSGVHSAHQRVTPGGGQSPRGRSLPKARPGPRLHWDPASTRSLWGQSAPRRAVCIGLQCACPGVWVRGLWLSTPSVAQGHPAPCTPCRTATVWRSLSPFWGEEYTVHLPLDFHHLALYVLDEDTVGHDDVIGKISLTKEAIAADPRGIDSWINLSPVRPDTEVQGEICLAVQMLEDARGRGLRCHVRQARDLAPRDISGTSDPFARVFWGGQSSETSTIKKTRFPHWDEVLELREMPGAASPLRVELWDWDMVGKNDFLGMVEFPPQTLQQKPPNGWFRLLPFPGTEEDSGGSLGALRLKVRLTEDRVLPSQHYQPLMALLLESVRGPVEEDTASPLAVLEEVASGDCRRDLATTLVKLFLGQGLAGPLLDYLTRREVARTRDPNTLFRSNSLASKSMQQFMKLVGMRYLHEVLKPVVSRVFEERKYVELDPCKMDLSRARRISFKGAPSEDQVRESSLGLLTGYLGPIVDAIVGSVARCPPAMRRAFKQLRLCVEERFPQAEHQDVKYLAISGFLFLRFFAPAILTPKLFDLRDQHADPQTSRSLLLLAKAVQSIGNLGQQLGQGKELWMAPLHPFLLQSISRVRAFLDELVDVDGEEEAGGPARALVPPSVTLREGYLLKRKEEPAGLATRFAFKKRYFRLSGEDLSYAKSPECQVRSSIPVSHIRAVERVDEGAFQLPHVMQVVTQDGAGALHTTYLQCKNVNELNQWLSALRKASAPNQDKLAACHPGAFRGGRWTCCLQAERPAVGCSRTHSAVTLGDWSDPLDPDAETQMVYRQLLLGRDQLRMKFLEDSHLDTGLEADTGRGPSATHGTCPEFLTGQRAAAAHLLEVLADLDRAHEEFQRQGQVAPGPPGP
ncbi:rasGAP-activating-like protein 1 isoform X1 [Sciurus carolinensis]|uniref:rasGAP-activating-like protein 1 isoform X1 n=2 Tax=Sciurus carolinensis TaxID=30640 RepID=UPI001FB4E2DA|nr:rasGAP-activating-like protein 1 isoform X1 [Sciurus carolinensis]